MILMNHQYNNCKYKYSNTHVYIFCIQYNGANYYGLEYQYQLPTIILEVKKALYKIVNKNIILYIGGRTDSGVHANQQIISCTFTTKLSINKLKIILNNVLPKDICISKIFIAYNKFHARYHSIGKKYIYRISNNIICKNIFYNILYYNTKLDLIRMKQASQYLLGEHNFNGFRSHKCISQHAYRYLWYIHIYKINNIIKFDIRGNAFCHNMIKIMVSTLLKIGSNYINPKFIKTMLYNRKRYLTGYTLSSHGLTLEQIYYPYTLNKSLLSSKLKFPKIPITLLTWHNSNVN